MTNRLDALSRLKNTTATPVDQKEQPLVLFEQMEIDGCSMPVFHPAGQAVRVEEWVQHNAEYVESCLLKQGVLLFRGFDIKTPQMLESLARSTGAELFSENGEHQRGNISEHVYTPVFYAPEKRLLWHNENSFNQSWPRLIWFCCAIPAQTGGDTPIVDSRKVYQGIDKDLRDEFVRKGVMYVRNYSSEGVGLDWQTVFQTKDRAEVGARCAEEGFTFEWKDGNRLKTTCVRPAAIQHPKTRELSWFNQAQHWHMACLDAETRSAIQNLYSEEDAPRTCCFGDGSPIPDDSMEHILEVYDRLEYSFHWRTGDVMMVDNVLSAHARNAYSGERKLLVAMGEMTDYCDIE